MRITLSQGLKLKNKLTKEIADLQRKIQTNNSIIEGGVSHYDIPEMMAELNNTTSKLILLKVEIQKANVNILKEIYELGELKSTIKFLRGISTVEGIHTVGYSQTSSNYSVTLNVKDIDSEIKLAEKEIDTIQNVIDGYNYQTIIELVD